MNVLPLPKQVQIISLLTDGMSIRATARHTGADKDSVMRLSKRIGDACQRLHHARMRGLQVSCLELDETWSFVRKKQQNVQEHDPSEYGDAYLWLAIDAHTKLIVSYLVGKRTGESAQAFVADVRGRVINRPQITTDALSAYADAIDRAFGGDVDYVMKNKKAGGYPIQRGHPDMTQVTTNHIERFNLSLRTQLRRHTRRTSGHSKKMDHHQSAIALLIASYNFTRIHETLRVTPAMEYGLTNHVWSVGELIEQALVAPIPEPLPQPPAYPRPDRRPFKLYVVRGGKMR